MHTPSIGASGCFLSVRSSCDRCRGQKLKCSVPPGSSTCERCARAKLVCVFGRRTPSRRSRQGHSARENTSNYDNAVAGGYGDHGAISPPSEPLIRQHTCHTPISNPTLPRARQFSPWANSQIQYLNDNATTYMPVAEQHQQQLPNFPPDALSPISEQDLSHLMASTPTYSTRTWDAVQLPGQSDQDATCMTTDYNWTQHSFDAFEANLAGEDFKRHCGQELACGSSGSQSPAAGWLSPESSYTATSILAETLGASELTSCENVPISPLLTSQRLLVLISEMQDWLAKDQQSPWFGNGENTNLDDYPVGAVLQFSQQLTDCARLFLDTRDCSTANNGLDYFGFPAGSRQSFGNHSPSSASKSSGPLSVADAPTTLLLLSGYMTFVRIFNITLGHFQQYLTRMPMPSRHAPRGTPTTTSSLFGATAGHIAVACRKGGVGRRTLRLGELHYATEAAAAASTVVNNASSIGGLQKMHLAVSMLLEEWQDVEAYLGPDGRVARELVVASLVQDGQESGKDRGRMIDHESPGERVMAVKNLLREKMGL